VASTLSFRELSERIKPAWSSLRLPLKGFFSDRKIKEQECDCIPVVEFEGSKMTIGILTMNDIVAAYTTQMEELKISQLLQDYHKYQVGRIHRRYKR
jgi:hypothetical protein